MSRSERLANIESLRIIAILMIVLMHGIGCVYRTTNTWNLAGYTLVNAFGNMGVTIFIIISGYFGLHFRPSRAVNLWLTMFFYSLLIFLVLGMTTSHGMQWNSLYTALTPVSSCKWWFMTCYFVLFFLSPFVNKVVDSLSQDQMKYFLGLMILFFVLFPTILRNPITHDGGKGFPNFILAYFIGQYIAKYDLPKKIVKYSGTILLSCGIIIFLVDFIIRVNNIHSPSIFCKDNNLFIVLGAISFFLWVRKHPFHSPAINYLAGYSFPLYLMNMTVLSFLIFQYKPLVNSVSIWTYFIIVQLEIFFIVFIVEFVRRMILGRTIKALEAWTDGFCSRILCLYK